MENKEKGRKCSGCRYYKTFYTKGASGFYREKSGYCEQKQKAVGAKECCGFYKYRMKKERTITMEGLESVMLKLEELELVFSHRDR